MEKTIREMATKIALHENTIVSVVDRFGEMEKAIAEIAGHVERQAHFNQSVSTTVSSLVEEVKMHHGNFQEVAWVLRSHDQFIAKNDAASEQMTQYINELIKDNENKSLWIGTLMREAQAQAQVLQQHQVGQQVLAEVIKRLMNHPQRPQQQTVTGCGPTVTEVDERGQMDQDFQTGQNPHTRPPDRGSFGVVNEPPQVPRNMEIVEQF